MGWNARIIFVTILIQAEWPDSTPIVLTDVADRIIATLVGRPADSPGRPSWDETTGEALHQMETLNNDLSWNGDQTLPRPPSSDGKNTRGDYNTCSLGPGFGGGQDVCGYVLL